MPAYDKDEYGYGIYGADREPIVSEHIIDYFPDLFKRFNEDRTISTFGHYVNAHEAEIRDFDANLSYVQMSRQISNAKGEDLERVGGKFGELGKRRNRSDDEYRAYLQGIAQSFRGRGTVPGLKYAIASSIGTTSENVIIDEDFDNNSYDVRIEDTDVGFLSSVVNDVSELADPSGVELANPPVIIGEGADVRISATESSVIESTSGLGSDGLTLDGSWDLS